MKRKLGALALFLAILMPPSAAALSGSEADFIFDNHSAAMLIVDASTGAIIDVNSAAAAFYGYSEEELRAMNLEQLSILSKEEVKSRMNAALSGERSPFILQHRIKDGTSRDVEVYSTPAIDSLGHQVLLLIVHDITDQAAAQRDVYRNRIIVISVLAVSVASLTLLNLYTTRIRRKERELRRRYQGLFSHMNEGFALHEILCDETGAPVDYRFLDVNHAFEEITGLQAEQIRNRTVREVMPATEQEWIDRYGEVALHHRSLSFERYSGVLGKFFHVNVFSPEPRQFATIFSDITDQVQAKEKIEEERNLLEAILEDAMSGYWSWNLPRGEMYLSPSLKRMLGYENREVENTPEAWRHLLLDEDFPLLQERYQQHVESHGKIPFYNEIRFWHKNGSVVWVICSGRVVERQGNTPIRMAGSHINITNMKNLEAALHTERSLFKTTLHSLGDAVISADRDGRVDLMNAVAETLTGWTHREAKGLPFESVFHIINENTGVQCPNPVDLVFKTGEVIELANHTVLIRKDGSTLPIEDSAAPIIDEDGAVSGVVLVFRDFTDKKEKQERIRYLSNHDQLTTLYNRHYFEAQLSLLDVTENLPFTIVMADVNGLKLTNDAFGHHAGDMLLKKVAIALKKACRPSDIVARVGGDEFVLLLPKTTHSNTASIIDRISKLIQQEKQDNVVVSVSFGWDTKETPEQNIVEVLTRAEEHMYRKKLVESQSMRNQTIRLIMQALQETNSQERVHAETVSRLCRDIGRKMQLGDDILKELEVAALMHDIGKIALNENLLNKPGALTQADYDEIKRHPEIGYHILKSADAYTGLADYVLSHHERWDGTGYPRELAGEAIPLVARIIAVADAFEAMTGQRPHKKAPMTPEEATEEIQRCAGTQFDPAVVDAFLAFYKET